MEAEKAGAAKASRHFSLPYDRVKKWAQRAGYSSRTGQPLTEKARAQIAKMKKERERARKAAQPARVRPPTPMTDEVRDGLNEAVRNAVSIIRNREWVEANPNGFAALSRGLKDLVGVSPDILALPSRLRAADTSGDSAPDDLAAAMGVDLTAPPTLTVLSGAKADEA